MDQEDSLSWHSIFLYSFAISVDSWSLTHCSFIIFCWIKGGISPIHRIYLLYWIIKNSFSCWDLVLFNAFLFIFESKWRVTLNCEMMLNWGCWFCACGIGRKWVRKNEVLRINYVASCSKINIFLNLFHDYLFIWNS